MPIIEVTSLEQQGVEVYGTLTEAQLRNRLEPDKGIFIAESPKVINVALELQRRVLAIQDTCTQPIEYYHFRPNL